MQSLKKTLFQEPETPTTVCKADLTETPFMCVLKSEIFCQTLEDTK